MESDPSSIFRHKKSSSSDRFLGIFSQSPNITSVGSELQENDILWSVADEDLSSPSPQPSPIRTIPTVGFSHPSNSGILAALPETQSNPDRRFLHRKASIIPPSTSRITIPSIPKPQSPREHSSHQSAPVNVPVRIPMVASVNRRKERSIFEAEDDEEGDDKMLPPHEIVARGSARSPMTTFSVLEGKGRTLKGRDLRRVRNAVFRQTGFLD